MSIIVLIIIIIMVRYFASEPHKTGVPDPGTLYLYTVSIILFISLRNAELYLGEFYFITQRLNGLICRSLLFVQIFLFVHCFLVVSLIRKYLEESST